MYEFSDEEYKFLLNPNNFPCLCYCIGDNKFFVAERLLNEDDMSVLFVNGWIDRGYYRPIINYKDIQRQIIKLKQQEIDKITKITDKIVQLTEVENILKGIK